MEDKPLYKEISCSKARNLYDENAQNEHFVVIDFRSFPLYEISHLPGAVCYDESEEPVNEWLSKFDRNGIYLLYCSDNQASAEGLLRMKKLKFRTVYRMKEGIRRWKELGFPVQTTA